MNTTKKTKLLCLLLCLVMVLPMALSACNGDDDKPDETTAATTEAGSTQAGGTSAATTAGSTQGSTTPTLEGPKVEEWVDVYDMGENGATRVINFLSCADQNDQPYNTKYYFIRHEEDEDVVAGDKMAESAKTRTLYMEETFNIAFNVIGHPSGQLPNIVQSSLMGSGGEYDLIYPHPQSGVLTFLTNGLFQNLYSFVDENDEQIIHLDQPWWNQSQAWEHTIDGRLFMAVNDMSICGQGFIALVYNRDLYNELQIEEDPYTLVYDGEWTMAKLQELAMLYGEGAGDDGILNYNDKIGLMWQCNPYWPCGGRVISKTEEGEFYIAIETDQTNAIVKEFYNLIRNDNDHVWEVNESGIVYATFGGSKQLASFKAGNFLFYSYDLGGLYKHLWNAPFDIGYLPNPKLDANQENYYSVCAAGYFGIPQKVKDNKVSASILEALAVHSYTNHRVNFFDDILLSRMSENPADFKMLNFIHQTKIYDWGSHLLVANESNNVVGFAVSNDMDTATTIIRGRKKSWQSLLTYLEDIKEAEFGG